MQYGHFDDEHKEYVIDRPDTPRSWTNYLGSTEYGAIITNNAGGYSFFRSAADGRFTRLRFDSVPLDQPGRYFYIRDNVSSDYWSSSWQPVGKPLDQYRTACRHGTAYTIIESEYANIQSEATYFVPIGRSFETWILKLTNTGDAPRTLSVFTYVEWANEWNAFQDLFNLQFSQHAGQCRCEDGIVDMTLLNGFALERCGETRKLQSFLTISGADIAGFDTDRAVFLGGPHRTYANPLVVETGRCTGSTADGDDSCGTLQVDLTLEPGESKEFVVLMGIGDAATVGAEVRSEFDSVDKAQTALAELKAYWHSRLGRFVVKTPDPEFDSMVNVWNAYNCLITYAWSRSASLVYSGERNGLGYRDTVQDIMAVLPAIPDEAGERLELMLTGQYSTGGAKPVIQPFEHKPGTEPLPETNDYRSDDCLWFFNTVPLYVKETGDLDFYRKVLPYADAGEDTVLGHLRRAIEFNLERHGAHGLPSGLMADWNDCIGEQDESVFVSFQVRYALTVYEDICGRLNEPGEAAWAAGKRQSLDETIQAHCWDGEWFIRSFHRDGGKVGSRENEHGSIYLNAQSWAVISGTATPEQAVQAMDAVQERLATEFGIMIFAPPFPGDSPRPVASRIIPPGQKENAGIFCHTQGWAVMAEALLGRGDRAYKYCRAYMPAAYNTRAEIREIEPYVYAQSTHSKYSSRFGASRLPWLSGTASWSYVASTQYILGIRPEYNGLLIDPCLPLAWDELSVSRTFRGKRFDITIRNGEKGKGVERMVVNGQEVAGKLVPMEGCKEWNEVEVRLC